MAKKDYTSKPCKNCGSTERYKGGQCAPCHRAYQRRYRKNNPSYDKNWRRNNPEKIRAYQQKWREENPDKIRISKKKWREKNPDKIRAYNKEYQRKPEDPDKKSERNRNYWKENPEKKREYDRNRRARKQRAEGNFTSREFNQLCEQYDYRCLMCGKKKAKLTADHVIPLVKGGVNTIDNIQPLCTRCNSSKNDKIRDYRSKPTQKRWIQRKLF